MDKLKLNNEIVLCRGAVRKARVAVIRKAIKKMKILKSCKNEALKEKKLRKSERVFKKIQIMKKLKDDEVTKFALINADIEKFFNEPKSNLKEKALASLAKHDAVSKKVNAIREQIPDWEKNLPLLLESLGKKKKLFNKKENTGSIKSEKTKVEQSPKKDVKTFNKKDSNKKLKVRVEERIKDESSDEESNADEEEKSEEKIDDPFFIEKKIIRPKLFQEDREKPTEKIFNKFQRDNSHSIFNAKPFRAKKEAATPSRFARSKEGKSRKVEKEESTTNLHPSWAAKKIQLIKPFQGKKTTFAQE